MKPMGVNKLAVVADGHVDDLDYCFLKVDSFQTCNKRLKVVS
jgi:hypothetical protein